jgi:hypothetical protein
MNGYLIPANSKQSLQIFGIFDIFDLILFGSGLGISILLLMIVSPSSLWGAILDSTPGLICGFLVIPVPNYHNMRTIIKDIYGFYTRRERFIWKGWCVKDEYGDKK